MFAGPNGSGKSTLIEVISKNYSMGYYINADNIEADIKNKGFIDCSEYIPTDITQADWNDFVNTLSDSRMRREALSLTKITKSILLHPRSEVDSYYASIVAEFLRNILMKSKESFSFETVMSHPSKVEFLEEAKKKGFKTYLYFISTGDPSINITRVNLREKKGGHGVSEEKIRSRYDKSMELLYQAFLLADRAFIIDSSTDKLQVLIEKDEDEVQILSNKLPEWINIYLLDKLKQC